mmetsp:Transcript_14275/g.30573  ORF Transcript_14275/g.30573 Transcript_14275/m.30573 type:complete len:224 (+) Transcript_14275:245-916(+)
MPTLAPRALWGAMNAPGPRHHEQHSEGNAPRIQLSDEGEPPLYWHQPPPVRIGALAIPAKVLVSAHVSVLLSACRAGRWVGHSHCGGRGLVGGPDQGVAFKRPNLVGAGWGGRRGRRIRWILISLDRNNRRMFLSLHLVGAGRGVRRGCRMVSLRRIRWIVLSLNRDRRMLLSMDRVRGPAPCARLRIRVHTSRTLVYQVVATGRAHRAELIAVCDGAALLSG